MYSDCTSDEIRSTGFYQLSYRKQTTGLNWSPCSNAAAVNQQVLGLFWRLMELILEGASHYLKTAGPKSAMTRHVHTKGTTTGGGGGVVQDELPPR